MTCITALTAQNSAYLSSLTSIDADRTTIAMGVKDVFPVTDQKFIETAIAAVFDDMGVDAVKTGNFSKCHPCIKSAVSNVLCRHAY